jgi:aspartyl/asparaginyl-tRNA synthetase
MLFRCSPHLIARKTARWYYQNSTPILPPTIKQLLASSPGTEVNTTVTGFVKSIRKQKRIAFADISDGSTPFPLQAVIEAKNVDSDVIHR